MRFLAIVTGVFSLLLMVTLGLGQENENETRADNLESYQGAIQSIDADLEKALQELAELRKKIAAEKPPLARQSTETAMGLREAIRQSELAKVSQSSIDHELKKKEDLVKLWSDERVYFDNLLAEFTKTYRGTVLIAEEQSLKPSFDRAEKGGDNGTQSKVMLLFHLIDELPELGKARSIEGSGLNTDGSLIDGSFAVAGPVAWFLSEDGTLSGLASESRSLQSEIITDVVRKNAIESLLSGESSEVSFDPTLGNAIAMRDVKGFDLLSYIRKGGIWIYPILALAAFALLAAIIKWIQLMSVRKIRPGVVREIVGELAVEKVEAANALAANIKHPARQMLQAGIDTCNQPVEDVEESLYEKYIETLPVLKRGLPLIAVASATAPLLGLLGTVTGMIKTFELIEIFGTGDAQTLSGGISEALITTAFGLIVAIPALIMHAILSRKVSGVRTDMEVASLAFINELKQKVAAKQWKSAANS